MRQVRTGGGKRESAVRHETQPTFNDIFLHNLRFFCSHIQLWHLVFFFHAFISAFLIPPSVCSAVVSCRMGFLAVLFFSPDI